MKYFFNLIILFFLFFGGQSLIFADSKSAPESRLWNLQDADILSVINEVSLETGKNFAVDPRVSGKISLISSKPIKPDEVYDIFLSVLELLGYSAIPNGNIIKIVPNTESGESATAIATNTQPGKGGEVVVRVIALENISANQLIPIVRPMLPQWSNVAAYTPGNVLILLGRASNIERIVKVIHNIDKTSATNIEVIPLHQASATQLANVLSNLQNNSRSAGDIPQVSIAADERSNSILLSGNKYARLHMRALIAKLDNPTQGIQGNTEVVYLRYLKAKEFAPILGKIVQHMLQKGTNGTAAAGSTSPSGYNPAGQAKNGKTTPENDTSIQAEPGTNALIITAPSTMMRSLNSIIAKVDIRPAQVLVEAVIVEIDQDDINNLGIQWGSRPQTSSSTSSSSTTGNVITNNFPPYGENVFGIIPGVGIQAVLSALQNKTGANILSTPSIVVLDNKKATLEVGKSVPQETGSYSTTGSTSTVTPFQTISNIPVTLRLDVIPQINLGNAVRLTIELKNDSLQNPDNPTLTPIINTSKIKNSVIVNSQDILVIGGLISSNLIDSEDKIPIISEIPIVGTLFRHKTRRLEKRNLMVFIKPIILHNSQDGTNITYNKYDIIRRAQINWPVDLSRPEDQKRQNILPMWKNNVDLPVPFSKSKL